MLILKSSLLSGEKDSDHKTKKWMLILISFVETCNFCSIQILFGCNKV
jgi:hypothetical protein